MLTTVAIAFVLLLLLGVPIAAVLAGVTALTVALHTNTPLLVLPQQIFNALDNFVLLAIPFFVLAGRIMTTGTMAQRLVDVMRALVGNKRGGLAVTAVLACLFFAALSGSSPATVVAIGSIMIPALTRSGYPENFAVGLVTASGSLGIVIPPSIPMILYALVMNVSVAELFLAGIVPGLFIGSIFIGYVVWRARREKWRVEEGYTWAESLRVVRRGIWALFLPVIVLGGIYSGVFTPTEAAAVSVVYALFVEAVIHRGLTVKGLHQALVDSAVLSGSLLLILSCAMTFVWLLTSQGLPLLVAEWILGRVDSAWTFLLLVNVLFLLLGSVGDNVSAMLILSPIFAETLQRLGIDPVHYGILMVLGIEAGFLTPPFGLNLFVAMGLTKKPMGTVALATAPFVLLLLGALLVITFVPAVSLWLPQTFYR
ncbi:MAG: TRAP transporter large permease subunit [Deferrisomatales bacterium]|nr:TRAP transporter large permease subunit [Deferrisomatales bacterium]